MLFLEKVVSVRLHIIQDYVKKKKNHPQVSQFKKKGGGEKEEQLSGEWFIQWGNQSAQIIKKRKFFWSIGLIIFLSGLANLRFICAEAA